MIYTAKTIELIILNESSKELCFDEFEGLLNDDTMSILKNSVDGKNLHSIFDTTLGKFLLGIEKKCTNGESFAECLKNGITERAMEYLNSASFEDEKKFRHLVLLLVAVANLKVFVEHNWVGPPLDSSLIWTDDGDMTKKSDEWLRPIMLTDGEDVTVVATNLVHLFIARHLLVQFREELAIHCKTSKFWLMRCLWIQQFLYNERLSTLRDLIVEIIEEEEKSNDLFASTTEDRDSFMQFHLESCHINYFYYEPEKAERHMDRVREVSGLSMNSTGVLGKRTRFQQSSLSQLVLQVKRLGMDNGGSEDGAPEVDGEMSELPKNMSLDDEAVLDKMQWDDPESVRPPILTPLEQCFILGLCYSHRKSKEGHSSILKEEMMAYLNCVLSQPQSWCIEAMTLFTRSRWEYEGTRYLQRSLLQLEELSNQYRKPSKKRTNRLSWVFTSNLPPHWTIEHELGERLDGMGLTNSALEVFERLQMWDEVIRCHAALSNKNKAEALIRHQLSVKETPLLWCYLGDVTKDENCYVTAWELSGCRFARAQRSLAFHYFGKREFEKSLEYFEKSLEINPLQIGVWFSYGCACLRCEQYDKAAVGFRRTVNLDNDNFEAWNNLASAYIKTKNKSRALLTLQEALKCNYDNWKIWDNILTVSVSIGQFEESMRSYHRLLDLKKKHNDVEVLTLLTRAVCQHKKDASGQDSFRLRQKLLELFGHVTSKVTNDADVWRLYAQVVSSVDEGQTLNETSLEKVLQFLQKSHRCSTSLNPSWEKNPAKSIDVCERMASLAEAYKSYLSTCTDEAQKNRIVSSAKLAINGVIVTAKRGKIDFPPGENLERLDKCLEDLEGRLEGILKMKSQ